MNKPFSLLSADTSMSAREQIISPRGQTFDPLADGPRLARQLDRVKALMADGNWRFGGGDGSGCHRRRNMNSGECLAVECAQWLSMPMRSNPEPARTADFLARIRNGPNVYPSFATASPFSSSSAAADHGPRAGACSHCPAGSVRTTSRGSLPADSLDTKILGGLSPGPRRRSERRLG